MDSLPKDTSFVSEGCMLDNFPTIGSSDIDFLLKQEIFPSDLTGNFDLAQGEVSFIMKSPDSTEMQHVPPPTSALPSMENYAGPYDFDIVLNKSQGARSKWEFSEHLNQMFVMMDCKVPIKFKWNQKRSGLFVRALPVFLAQDSFEEPVRRCASHSSPMEKSNEGFPYVEHIIRCDHSHTLYESNLESKRLSVVVPLDLPQPGSDGTTVVYSFMCKNSCPVGMNRRSTAVIFTLERASGDVVGRKFLNLRICSCPRRDKIKAELVQKEMKHPAEVIVTPPPGKKVLKRLKKESTMVNFNIRLPRASVKSVATIIRELFIHSSRKDETGEDLIAVEDCNKYI